MATNAFKRAQLFGLNGKNFKTGWLITAGIVALYIGLRPRSYQYAEHGIASSRGISVDKAEVRGSSYEERIKTKLAESRDRGIIGGVEPRAQMASFIGAPSASAMAVPQQQESDRKIVRTSFLDLIVQKPAETADRIRQLAENVGGFLVESQLGGGQDATSGSLTIRVPAARFEEARSEIRKLGLRVQSERIQAQDVTKQYVDEDANLRNLRAEEAQYLAILKQAHTVKDTLDVSEKLGDVRGQIEQQQAEFEALTKQIETAAISISLESEAEARVFGMNWRPLYQVKLAVREGLDGMASYASAMTSAIFLLPTVLLWLATIIVVSAGGWKILRWAGRLAFGTKAVVSQA